MSKLSAKAKSRVYSQLATYAKSGMGMEKAAASLLQQPGVGRLESEIYANLQSGVKSGRSIADALAAAGPVISPMEHQVMMASEKGGRLEKGFSLLSSYFRRLHETRERMLKGLAYPVILLHVAIPACTLAYTSFRSFNLNGNTPSSGLSHLFTNTLTQSGKTMGLVYLTCLLLVFLALWLLRLSRRSPATDTALNRIPLLGKARQAIGLERFTHVFGIFLTSGMKISETLSASGRASGRATLDQASQQGAHMVENGSNLAQVFFSAPHVFPNDFARGIAVAEESGQLDVEMEQWGSWYSEIARQSMERLAEWTPRLFYWGILLLVASMIIRVILAYGDMLTNLLNT